MILPGPHGSLAEWEALHAALKRVAHDDLDMLDAAGTSYTDVSREWEASPWTNGGCGLFAHGVVAWMNDPRATWQVIGKRFYPGWRLGRDPNAPDYDALTEWDFPHAIVVYRSAAIDRVYFDAVMISQRPADFARLYGAHGVFSRTKRSNAHMAENYGCYPWDERHVELIRQTLLAHFGRWPRR